MEIHRKLNSLSYKRVARANRKLAMTLQEQGLSEDAIQFAYRAQILQRKALKQQRNFLGYTLSLFLDALSGYGYRPGKCFLAYLFVIGVFMSIYCLLSPHLAWNEAFVISITAFHGRGFFPSSFSPSDPLAFVSAIEAFVGLIIEVTFIATLTQRIFSK